MIDWKHIALKLIDELDTIEFISDPESEAPEGVDRLKQVNMFALDALTHARKQIDE